MAEPKRVPVRGYLLHLTHYDPAWFKRKAREKPPDMKLAAELVDAMGEAEMNLLVVDCADGVRYRSHPELKRRYSVPMSALKKLAARARKRGIEVVPKLNFAVSHFHKHHEWFRPHHWLFDNDEYWRIAFELIGELIEACGPERFFHVGMDEDHGRSHAQYARAVIALREGLAERGLRAVMWKDEQTYPAADVHREKARASERKIPKDVVQVVWHYKTVLRDAVRRLRRKGFEVWGAPGADPEQVAAWRDCLLRCGGQGLLLTQWIPCRPGNRRKLLRVVGELGPVCAGREGAGQ